MGQVDQSPRSEFLHYTSRGDLEGLRQGDWKLLVKKPRQNRNKQPNTKQGEALLFNLEDDIGEKNNLADKHPDIVEKLRERMTQLDEEITSNARTPWFKNN